MGKKLSIFGLPSPSRSGIVDLPQEILRATSCNVDTLQQFITKNEPKLLQDQRRAYNMVLDDINNQNGMVFFLDAPGGTVKTFVTTLLLSEVRQQRKIALAVASSGIAAAFLPGGHTVPSSIKLPLNMATNETPTSNICKGSEGAMVPEGCQLIV